MDEKSAPLVRRSRQNANYTAIANALFDYPSLGSVEAVFISAPAGADWAHDRERLWNAAEAAERRKNSTLAREYEIAIPVDMRTPEGRLEVVRDFAHQLVDRYAVAVDVAIHPPSSDGDQCNWHAHLLSTTRPVGAAGLGARTRQFDAKESRSVEIEAIRRFWAVSANRALARTSRRTGSITAAMNAGVERMPSEHLGPHAANLERRALREQGFEIKPEVGVAQTITVPGFEPATDRGFSISLSGLRGAGPQLDRAKAPLFRKRPEA